MLVRIKALGGQCVLSVHCIDIYIGGQMTISRWFGSIELDDLNNTRVQESFPVQLMSAGLVGIFFPR